MRQLARCVPGRSNLVADGLAVARNLLCEAKRLAIPRTKRQPNYLYVVVKSWPCCKAVVARLAAIRGALAEMVRSVVLSRSRAAGAGGRRQSRGPSSVTDTDSGRSLAVPMVSLHEHVTS
jgi:hypothetical protein